MFKFTCLLLAFAAVCSTKADEGVVPGLHPYVETSPYVVNGTEAEILNFPYMCSLRVSGNHNCGASILSKRFLVTAAHCSGTTVQCGQKKISPNGEGVYQIRTFLRHKDYSSSTLVNDIALIELVDELEWSPSVQPVALPPSMYEVKGNWDEEAVLSGYGLDRTGGSIQTTLQEVDLLVASNEHCSKVHSNRVYDSMICAGVPEGGKGQCSGDSGGPLREYSTGYQIGIVSWSMKPCTIAPYPGVYTKVSHHCGWLEENTDAKCGTTNY